MNGKYKETFDEIKVSEELKMNLKEKIRKENMTMENNTEEPMANNQRPKRNISTWALVGVAACLLVIACVESITGFRTTRLSTADPVTNTTIEEPEIPSDPVEVSKVDSKIKKFSGEDELLKISKENTKQNNFLARGDIMMLDGAVEETESVATNAETKSADTTQSTSANTAGDYSKTNVQVENVDEEDIIKTDGKYIYILNSAKNQINVIDAESGNLVTKKDYGRDDKEYSKNIFGMFLYNDKIAVVTSKYFRYYDEPVETYEENKESDELYISREYPKYQQITELEIYNFKDNELNLERTVSMTGNYVSSRMIDGNLYFITNENSYSYYRSRRYVYLPTWEDAIAADGIIAKEAQDIYYVENPESTSYTNIGVINLDNPNQEMTVESIYGFNTDNLYMSTENLYLWKTNYSYNTLRYFYVDGDIVEEETKIDESVPHDTCDTSFYRISVDGTNIKIEANGNVPGQVLNQFSVDEYDGNLRVATTRTIESRKKMNYSSSTNNNLYILNKDLTTIGKIEGFEEGERIYSVRFMGARGFVVTFEAIDPLLTMDLSDPRNPKIVGKLEIPGVSNYMQLYDENHIIGIGEDVKDNGYGGYTRAALKISYFDISDMSNPIEVNKLIIGDSTTSSEAEFNHKTVLLSKEKGILVIPVSSYGYENKEVDELNGSLVFDVDAEKGVTQKGILKNAGRIYHDSRTIYIGNKYYKFETSSNIVNVYDMNSLELLNSIEY